MRKYFIICQLILFIIQSLTVAACFILPEVDKFTKYFAIAVDCFIFCMLLILLKNFK